jgi:hypothetical protein
LANVGSIESTSTLTAKNEFLLALGFDFLLTLLLELLEPRDRFAASHDDIVRLLEEVGLMEMIVFEMGALFVALVVYMQFNLMVARVLFLHIFLAVCAGYT